MINADRNQVYLKKSQYIYVDWFFNMIMWNDIKCFQVLLWNVSSVYERNLHNNQLKQ